MSVKHVFITGGVVFDLEKGITAVSLSRLLEARGYRVIVQKFDPYINTDPGAMNPIQHGEVFMTDDNAGTDLDSGYYGRFIDEGLTRNSNVTTSRVYWTVLQKERRGNSDGGTIQVTPHITSEIRSRLHRNYTENKMEIAIIEVGDTVSDIKSQPSLEAIHQLQHEAGPGNTCVIHITLIPYLKASEELKTKPAQTSIKDPQGMGIQPDILIRRNELPLDDGTKTRVVQLCDVPKHHVLQNLDVNAPHEVPLVMEEEHLAQSACECLDLSRPEPELADQRAMIEAWEYPRQDMTVALVDKHIQLYDAYISVMEALKYAGVANRAAVHIKWADSETVAPENTPEIFKDVSGILVLDGFDDRDIDGETYVIQYTREHRIPLLGPCLGIQLSIMEFARNAAGYVDTHSVEPNPATTHPVIHPMLGQNGVEDINGTLRLGSYPYVLGKTSRAYGLYGGATIYERYKHRYEVNSDYRVVLTKCSMMFSDLSPDGRIVEMIEPPGHPWFTATQAYPELKFGPNRPYPLSKGFVGTALKEKTKNDV